MMSKTTEPSQKWIGIDLNTTGSVVVIADPQTGFCAKLGREACLVHDSFNRERQKIRNKKNERYLKKINRRETEQLMDINRYLSREIIKIARELNCGIKFELIFYGRKKKSSENRHKSEFTINNWYFYSLCQMVENRAVKNGITVLYVDPSFTSQRCSRCGEIGSRHKKSFSCPYCGFTGHADVNAAFNIAGSPVPEPKYSGDMKNCEFKKKIRMKVKKSDAEKGEKNNAGGLGMPVFYSCFATLFENSVCEAVI